MRKGGFSEPPFLVWGQGSGVGAVLAKPLADLATEFGNRVHVEEVHDAKHHHDETDLARQESDRLRERIRRDAAENDFSRKGN